jgi:hypothetical protein
MVGSGAFRRRQSHIIPLSSTNAMTTNSSIRRRNIYCYSCSASSILMVLGIVTIVVVSGIFVKMLPANVSLTESLKSASKSGCIVGKERTWHGGHPAQDRPGSCWCGGDEYCMCTPSVAVDIVLYSRTDSKDGYSVWVVRRRDTGQLATIGGLVLCNAYRLLIFG